MICVTSPAAFCVRAQRKLESVPRFPAEVLIMCTLRDHLVSELAVNCRTAYLNKHWQLPPKQLTVMGDVDWPEATEDTDGGEFIVPPRQRQEAERGRVLFSPQMISALMGSRTTANAKHSSYRYPTGCQTPTAHTILALSLNASSLAP